LILFDKRGTGLSDHGAQFAALETRGRRSSATRLLEHGSPTLYASEEDRRWFANWMRAGASPAVAYALNRALLETDLRDVLPDALDQVGELHDREVPQDALGEAGQLLHNALSLAGVRPGASFVASASNARTR
jgi:hypothetical protein